MGSDIDLSRDQAGADPAQIFSLWKPLCGKAALCVHALFCMCAYGQDLQGSI